MDTDQCEFSHHIHICSTATVCSHVMHKSKEKQISQSKVAHNIKIFSPLLYYNSIIYKNNLMLKNLLKNTIINQSFFKLNVKTWK